MFRSEKENLILKKQKQKELLTLYRGVLKRIYNLKLNRLHVSASADFRGDDFAFSITVYTLSGDNTTFTAYDFWDVEYCKNLVDSFMTAIKTGDFGAVKAVREAA